MTESVWVWVLNRPEYESRQLHCWDLGQVTHSSELLFLHLSNEDSHIIKHVYMPRTVPTMYLVFNEHSFLFLECRDASVHNLRAQA